MFTVIDSAADRHFPMRTAWVAAFSLGIFLGSAGTVPIKARAELPQGSVVVTVEGGARQSFIGFGASLLPDPGYERLSRDRRTELARLLWHDLNFKVLRLWAEVERPGSGQEAYVASGMIRDALDNGATTLLLAPGGQGAANVTKYAQSVADIIGEYRKRGVVIHDTGVANEPGDGAAAAIKSPAQMAALVTSLRAALDATGSSSVKIIAPELANADRQAVEWLDFLRKGEAWRHIDGYSTHSYNMAATDEIAARLSETDKEYWITEAADNGPEDVENAGIAASVAARALNDFNHSANVWIFFIGYLSADPHDNATRIIAYDPRRDGADWKVMFLKYYYFKQLSQTFDIGARFRQSRSSLEGSMVWTYGKKPRIIASAAKNPDGSWGIGVVDYTSDDFLRNDLGMLQRGYGAQSFLVKLDIQEMHGSGQQVFDLYRSNAGMHDAYQGPVTAVDGSVSIRVRPLDLVTLRSRTVHAGSTSRER